MKDALQDRDPAPVLAASGVRKVVGGETEAHYVEAGESIVMRDPASAATRRLRVVRIVDADWALGGAMISTRAARAFLEPDAPVSRHFVAVDPGADPGAVAAGLTRRLIDHGADAESLRAVVDRQLSASRSFIALSHGFVALGLVIGIGGLGVVMVRAVRERRRQIGMLRAMGLPGATCAGPSCSRRHSSRRAGW